MTTSPSSQNPEEDLKTQNPEGPEDLKTQNPEEDLQTQNPNMTKDDDQQQQPPPPQSQSSETLTLETPDLRNPQQSDPDHQQDQQEEENPQSQEEEDPAGMSLSPPHAPITDTHITITIPDLNPENPPLTTTPTVYRRDPKRKKATRHKKMKKRSAAQEKKLHILTQNLKPISFVPNKTLDFSTHEKLLKRLGLWDFVHVELDRNVRADLLAQLIVNYNAQSRCSYVNEVRININRAALVRALKLPVKKDRINLVETAEGDSEIVSEESVAFVEDFVSNWVLLHEDMWMMPSEVLNWTRVIKEGHPEKVDWASLMWFMVEKEVVQGSQLVHCYYASHLQCLIKSQRPDLFIEEPKVEVNVKEEEEEDGVDVKIDESDDIRGQELEEPNIELSLGQDNVQKEQVTEEDVMDFEECREEENGQWLLDGKNDAGEHYLQPCNLAEVRSLDCDEEGKQEEKEQQEEEEEEQVGFNLSPKCNTLEGISSANLIQPMEEEQNPYSPPLQLHDHSSMEHLSSRAEINSIRGGPSIFGNASKREIDHEHDISHHSLNGNNKRLRSDGMWDPKSSDFDVCMEQIQHWMGKARMMYEAKEHACQESSMNQQILLDELQQRDGLIEHFQKTKYEEQQKRQVEIYRLERELYVMGNLLDGYRKALKETHRNFSEYRARSPLPDEPLYKDVGGTGGVVLSTMELEKQRLKQEEEDRMKRMEIEDKFKEFEAEWIGKFEVHLGEVYLLESKLPDVEKEVKLLKEVFAKRKVSDMVECSPNDAENVS